MPNVQINETHASLYPCVFVPLPLFLISSWYQPKRNDDAVMCFSCLVLCLLYSLPDNQHMTRRLHKTENCQLAVAVFFFLRKKDTQICVSMIKHYFHTYVSKNRNPGQSPDSSCIIHNKYISNTLILFFFMLLVY